VMNNGFQLEDFHSTFGQRMKNIYENHPVSSVQQKLECQCRIQATVGASWNGVELCSHKYKKPCCALLYLDVLAIP
jgi:hypothetical protein